MLAEEAAQKAVEGQAVRRATAKKFCGPQSSIHQVVSTPKRIEATEEASRTVAKGDITPKDGIPTGQVPLTPSDSSADNMCLAREIKACNDGVPIIFTGETACRRTIKMTDGIVAVSFSTASDVTDHCSNLLLSGQRKGI